MLYGHEPPDKPRAKPLAGENEMHRYVPHLSVEGTTVSVLGREGKITVYIQAK